MDCPDKIPLWTTKQLDVGEIQVINSYFQFLVRRNPKMLLALTHTNILYVSVMIVDTSYAIRTHQKHFLQSLPLKYESNLCFTVSRYCCYYYYYTYYNCIKMYVFDTFYLKGFMSVHSLCDRGRLEKYPV
jgi:hypothetical protein